MYVYVYLSLYIYIYTHAHMYKQNPGPGRLLPAPRGAARGGPGAGPLLITYLPYFTPF